MTRPTRETASPSHSAHAPQKSRASQRASRTLVAAAQAALAAEHAAVYGYGVVGGRVSASLVAEAKSGYSTHESRRDAMRRTVRDLGATPVAAAAGYELPFAVPDSAAAVRLAGVIEDRIAAVYADLVAVAVGELRGTAAGALRDAAVRAARWRGSSAAFPGLPDGVGGKGTGAAAPSGSPTAG
jgi:hypothetical protein